MRLGGYGPVANAYCAEGGKGGIGKDITPNMQKKIFQPGFSTKQRGWGLGLSLSKRIVEQYHHGRLFLKYSLPGQGTVFRLVLKK